MNPKSKKQKSENDSKMSDSSENIAGVEIIDEEPGGNPVSKPKMKRWKKVLLAIGGTIASLIIIVVIVYVYLVNSGKKSIYSNATSEKPSFRVTEKETDANGEEIKNLDMSMDDDGNILIFEGENENNC